MTQTASVKALTIEATDETRVVQQIVSVFGNVDGMGDRVMPGAFTQTLADWEASPNTMSVYFSHQWSDPFANIGSVIGAEELFPGDERLPADVFVTDEGKSLRELGGLLVTYQFDPPGENALADQVFRLMEKRRITQASFAYDVVAERNNAGVNELVELSLIEVGPTLLGVNRGTTTLSEKSMTSDEIEGEASVAEPESSNNGEAERVRLEADLIAITTTEDSK